MKKLLIATITTATLLLTGVASAKELASQVITVKAPEVVADNSVGTSTEIFMELVNKGQQNHTLIAAVSSVAEQTQLHKYVKVKGKETMRQVPSILIKRHNDKTLKPGGFHVMVMGIHQAVQFGKKLPLTLVFKDGSTIEVDAPIDKTQAYLNEVFGGINQG